MFFFFFLSVVFWFGDLNFRIEDLEMQVVKSAIDNNKLSILWEKDQVKSICGHQRAVLYSVFICFFSSLLQLNLAKDSETVLEGFQEGPLKFPPTYKFDIGTDTYDTRSVHKALKGPLSPEDSTESL